MRATGRETIASPFLTPPTENEVENYQKSGEYGPTLDRLNFDVTGYKPKSRWNRECASLLANAFVKSQNHCSTDDKGLEDKVKGMILTHVQALIIQYRKMHPSRDPKVVAEDKAKSVMNVRQGRRRNVSAHEFMLYLLLYLTQ